MLAKIILLKKIDPDFVLVVPLQYPHFFDRFFIVHHQLCMLRDVSSNFYVCDVI
jgi:hypothetical protein